MTAAEREYLAARERALTIMRVHIRMTMSSECRQWPWWDPFTPFGAGQADAALSCWGL